MSATVIFGQERKPFLTPAYQYVRKSDDLPSTDDAYGQDDPVCKVKLFDPTGSWTWFIAGFDPDTGLAYGVVWGFEREAGDIDMNELRSSRGGFGLPIERDIHWTPRLMSALLTED